MIQPTLDALAAQTLGDFRVVVLDNACPQGSGRTAQLPDDRFHLVTSDINRGFAGGSNYAAAVELDASGEPIPATEPWVITLNPDAVARPGWLAAIQAGVERHGAAVFGSTQLDGSGQTIDGFGDALSVFGLAWRGGTGQPASALPDGDREVISPCAAAACYRRDVFEAAGGFSEPFFCYLEDMDLGLRLRAQGYPCVQLRGAVVEHSGGSSLLPGSDFAMQQTLANTPRLVWRNAPLLLLPVMIPAMIAARLWLDWRKRAWSRPFWRALSRMVSARRDVRAPRPALGAWRGLLSWNPRHARSVPIRSKPLAPDAREP